MITLKLNTYSDEECLNLLKALHGMNAWLVRKCYDYDTEHQNLCPTCPHKHMCYDVDHAIAYIRKTLEERRLINGIQ